jgi:very-short-patch-repair endonuclease
VLGGMSAAAIHGSQWIDASLPAELYRIGDEADGILVHRGTLQPEEVSVVRGIPATTPERTAFDLGRRRGLTPAVIRVDALANATGLTSVEIEKVAARRKGARGVVQLRQVLVLMDGGAESAQETRTRLLLIRAGLPKPATQIVVHNDIGDFIGRIDMGYKDCQVGVEYDGPTHWTDPARHAADIDRSAKLAALGWRIVRVSAELLRYRSHVVIERVCDALQAAGCPWLADIRLDARFLPISV